MLLLAMMGEERGNKHRVLSHSFKLALQSGTKNSVLFLPNLKFRGASSFGQEDAEDQPTLSTFQKLYIYDLLRDLQQGSQM
jgi:hypothetical protein